MFEIYKTPKNIKPLILSYEIASFINDLASKRNKCYAIEVETSTYFDCGIFEIPIFGSDLISRISVIDAVTGRSLEFDILQRMEYINYWSKLDLSPSLINDTQMLPIPGYLMYSVRVNEDNEGCYLLLKKLYVSGNTKDYYSRKEFSFSRGEEIIRYKIDRYCISKLSFRAM